MTSLIVRPRKSVQAEISVPGDKSISHRAAILAALADGESHIEGFLPAEDCLHTLLSLRKMGMEFRLDGEALTIQGVGLRGLRPPSEALDLGNAGTGLALLMGVAAGQPFDTTLTGDDSLRRRPQRRIAEPLGRMGAVVRGQGESCRPPITVRGGELKAIEYSPSTPSAQVKSALLLAGLYAEGATTVVEIQKTRDHTERMLPTFAAEVKVEGLAVSVQPAVQLRAADFAVPGDISSAAFFLVATAILPGSHLKVKGVGINPTRTGLLEVLAQMGAKVDMLNQSLSGGEPIADVVIGGQSLRGVQVGGALIPRLVDEVPVLCVAACLAEGITEVRDAPQLRQKESDRIETIALELSKMGARIEPLPDGLRIHGGAKLRGARCDSHGDHRIAMSLAIAALAAEGITEIENTECIATSFPEFPSLLEAL